MYYIITQNGIIKGRNIQELDKKGYKLTQEDFKVLGRDYVLTLTNDDISFIKDAKKLSLIPFERLYRKESYNMYFYLLIGIGIINLIKG